MSPTLSFQSFLRVVLLLFLGACTGAEAQERLVLSLSDLPSSAGPGAGGTWQSVGFRGDDWHRFPGQAELFLEHGLGREPQAILVYISFEANGASAALASGDLALIRGVSENDLTLANRTNQDFFCRVVLE